MSAASASPEPDVEAGEGGRWKRDEDERLKGAVAELGAVSGKHGTWKAISQRVGSGRSDKSCKKRWTHSLDPNLRKGRWTAAEDAVLLKHFAIVGPKWHEIAEHIDGRTADQIAKRYRDSLDPEVGDKTPWTAEEDRILLAAHAQVGPMWTLICEKLPGRSGMQVRNAYRRLTRAASSPGGGGSPGPSRQEGAARASEAGPSKTQRLSAGASETSRSRSPGRPRIARESSASSTAESGGGAPSPFNFDRYYAAIASPAPSFQHQQQQYFPPVFDDPRSPSTLATPGPFTEAELAFLREFPPQDANDAIDWSNLPAFAPPNVADAPPAMPSALGAPPVMEGFRICAHCNGSGFVPSALGGVGAGSATANQVEGRGAWAGLAPP